MTKTLQGLGQYETAAVIERGELALAKISSRKALSQEAIDAINALTDPLNLERCGLSLAGTGQIVSRERRSIFLNAAHLSALRALLS